MYAHLQSAADPAPHTGTTLTGTGSHLRPRIGNKHRRAAAFSHTRIPVQFQNAARQSGSCHLPCLRAPLEVRALQGRLNALAQGAGARPQSRRRERPNGKRQRASRRQHCRQHIHIRNIPPPFPIASNASGTLSPAGPLHTKTLAARIPGRADPCKQRKSQRPTGGQREARYSDIILYDEQERASERTDPAPKSPPADADNSLPRRATLVNCHPTLSRPSGPRAARRRLALNVRTGARDIT